MSKNTYAVQQLVAKMKNLDSDLRFMALTDLISDIARAGDSFGVEDSTEHSLVEQVLSLLNDTNGEVKNLAVKTLATLVKRVSGTRIQTIIDRLVSFTASTDEGVRDISSLGLKAVVSNISPGTDLAATVCLKLAPKVIAQLENPVASADLLIDSLDLLSDIFSRFESTVRSHAQLQSSALKAAIPLLGSSRPAVRKRTVGMLAILVASSEKAIFNSLVASTVLPSLSSKNTDAVKTTILLIGSLARIAHKRLARKAAQLLPLVIAYVRSEDDDLKELVLQTLESLILRCPSETAPFFTQIIDAGTTLINHDPNYTGGDDDDEDVEMGSASDEENEDDDFGDEYSDDDDTSWKVRRAATKLLSACISTRPDLLASFYRNVSPSLIARFGEREETVKVEVWATYTALLAKTKAYVNRSTDAEREGSPTSSLKRKRSTDEMNIEEGPIALLRAQSSSVATSIIKQLASKSLSTRQVGFALLHELIAVLGGGLDGHMASLITRVETALKASDSGHSGATTSLKIEVLSFLGLLFRSHHAKTFIDELPRIVPILISAVSEKFNKIASEAFSTCTELVRALRPVQPSVAAIPPSVAPHLESIYASTMERLSGNDADEEVKGKGVACLGGLLYQAGDQFERDFGRSLTFLRDRLKNEVSRLVAVTVVAQLASSPVCHGAVFDEWVQECLTEVSLALRKVSRPLKVAAFGAIQALLDRSGPSLPASTSAALISDLQPLINDADTNLLPLALETISTLLSHDPSTEPRIAEYILPRIFELVQSPLLQGPSLEGVLAFFTAYVGAGADPLPLLSSLSQSADATKKTVESSGTQSGMQSLVTSSRCIGVIVRGSPGIVNSVVDEYAAKIQASKTGTAPLILGLLTLGEIGRVVDLGAYPKTFAKTIEHFSAASEDVRRSAAFAAGNMTVGNASTFLPSILLLIRDDDKKRYLALQALKEVILHSPPTTLETISDTLWDPLFDNCEAQEEGTRNVAADCLGQLTVMNPAKYLPQLQTRLSSDSHHTRGMVIAAVRFTFTNESTTYDELLAPLMTDFFRLIHDSDLGVRRLALTTLNSAAHNKPHLVRDHLSTLLPELYGQTDVDESLIRMVEMGPFKHKVDDGLDIRKTAYECMHTLLDTCLKDIEIHEYLNRVLGGLKDDEEVKKLCYLMLVKLSHIAPGAVAQRLDDAVPAFTETLQTTLKDNAVKQETERLEELQKAALRCMAVLNRLATPTTSPLFTSQLVKVIALGTRYATSFKELTAAANSAIANAGVGNSNGDAMQVD